MTSSVQYLYEGYTSLSLFSNCNIFLINMYIYIYMYVCPPFVGCPTYLAPEIIENVEPSIASDLWSMGCVLYEMYTGHPPFSDDNIQELMDKITNSEIPPIRVKGQFKNFPH